MRQESITEQQPSNEIELRERQRSQGIKEAQASACKVENLLVELKTAFSVDSTLSPDLLKELEKELMNLGQSTSYLINSGKQEK